jgi:hypothetical protein
MDSIVKQYHPLKNIYFVEKIITFLKKNFCHPGGCVARSPKGLELAEDPGTPPRKWGARALNLCEVVDIS